MSISSIQSRIQQLQRDVSDLQRKLSDASRKEGDAIAKIAQLQKRNTTSLSAIQTKLKDLSRLQNEVSRAQRTQSDTNKQIAGKTKDLHRYEGDLRKEEERIRKATQDAELKRRREHDSYQRRLTSELATTRLHTPAIKAFNPEELSVSEPSYDLFISHASEDKESFVRPLAESLTSLGVRVWYDEHQLRVGDSLRRSIDRGLINSRYGVVVLSIAFFAKNWPQYELDGMVAREMQGTKVVLPIWHKVSKTEVLTFSPTLADKVALNSSLLAIDDIAKELASVVAG